MPRTVVVTGGGSGIITIGSIAGRTGGGGSYGAAKAAIEA